MAKGKSQRFTRIRNVSQPSRFNLYPKSRGASLDLELFKNPGAIYRGVPFWAWNSKIDLAQLLRQVETFKAMGFGGACIHSRTGLATEYLGDEYLEAIAACTKKLAAKSMRSWLYDEDRWPSGYAGGIVTRDPQHRLKHLLWTTTPYSSDPRPTPLMDYTAPARTENGLLFARYEVTLRDGYLSKYRRLKDSEKPAKTKQIWHAYLESAPPSTWFNYQTYLDTFSRAAVERFLEVTHERLFKTLGKEFGNTCPAIFTDEPQFVKKNRFANPDEVRDLFMPWTDDFARTFKQTYKQDLLDHLPEIFWNLPDNKPSLARYRYHDHTAERFATAFGDTIGVWCEKHRIALTGHMLGEASLFSQTRGVGEAMRGLRSFHIPGIDILSDRIEFTTAKQAQSIAHQFNRPGVLSELYGVTNWDFDFLGHKAQGDWQAALGVTVRVPHLAWVSMAGESKRDYPASIGYQSPWHAEYPLIENHFARVNTVLSRGKPQVRIAVIHPIESLWLTLGPISQNIPEIDQREQQFRDLPNWLLYGSIDFDYLSESLLPQLTTPSPCTQGEGRGEGAFRRVGSMQYDAILLPNLRTIRSTTLKFLQRFIKSGGAIIFAGDIPPLVNASPSLAPSRLAKRCTQIPFDQQAILQSLEPFRDIQITHADGTRTNSILHQLRREGKNRHLFLCNTDRKTPRDTTIRIRGKWSITNLDTMTGKSSSLPASINTGDTILQHSFPAAGHLLLSLERGEKKSRTIKPIKKWKEIGHIDAPTHITLSEPNVLLLDQSTWRINEGAWQPQEEILRIDNLARKQLNLPLRTGRAAQPWADTSPAPIVAQIQLKFAIHSDLPIAAPSLALEAPESLQIHLDGQPIPSKTTGWWVDESIKTIQLPSITAGDHELLLTIPFNRKTDLEWCYLLGDFGVALKERHAQIVAPIRTLNWGDWTPQGLPFYAGNITYHCAFTPSPCTQGERRGEGAFALIEIPHFKSPLLLINLDKKPAGKIAFPPYQLELGKLTGPRTLSLTAYGNCHNAFGPLHNTTPNLTWVGPDAWRSTAAWSYNYQLKPMGILTAPIVKIAE